MAIRDAAVWIVAGLMLLPGSIAEALAADVGQSETIVVTPPQGKVGTRFNFVCSNFPEPKQGDTVYVVTAGTPDVDPNSVAGREEKILWKDYAVNCFNNKGHFIFPAGPFAPGTYEVRFMTTLYNNDERPEVATRTVFSVR